MQINNYYSSHNSLQTYNSPITKILKSRSNHKFLLSPPINFKYCQAPYSSPILTKLTSSIVSYIRMATLLNYKKLTLISIIPLPTLFKLNYIEMKSIIMLLLEVLSFPLIINCMHYSKFKINLIMSMETTNSSPILLTPRF